VAASCPADRAAYNTLGAVKSGVENAVADFGVQYKAGLRTNAERDKLKAIYQKWEAAHKLAVEVARHGGDGNLVTIALASADEVFNFLRTFGILRR